MPLRTPTVSLGIALRWPALVLLAMLLANCGSSATPDHVAEDSGALDSYAGQDATPADGSGDAGTDFDGPPSDMAGTDASLPIEDAVSDVAEGDAADDVAIPLDVAQDATVDTAPVSEVGDAVLSVVDPGGAAVAGATVTIGATAVAVDSTGKAKFTALAAGSVVAKATAPGHAPAAQTLTIVSGGQATGLIVLQKIGATQVVLTLAGTTTKLSSGQVSLALPADTFLAADGSVFAGQVTVDVTALDPSAGLAGAPGPLVGTPTGGAKPQPLQVAFLADVSFSGPDGKPLQLAAGKTATLTFFLPDATAKAFKVGQLVPAWYFDIKTASWLQDGVGAIGVDSDTGNKTFTAKVSHFTWWMGAQPISETGCLNVTVQKDGVAAAGIQVLAEGIDYASTSQGTTGANGAVCLEVKTGGTVRVITQDAALVQVGGAQLLTADATAQACGGSCKAVAITVEGPKACADVSACDDQNACTVDSCDAAGKCAHSAVEANGNKCDDGAPCTVSDACKAGVCASTALDCNDGASCTTDTCDASGACKHAWLAEGAACDDDQPCTIGEKCSIGSCGASTMKSCNDANDCTTDKCDYDTGGCVFGNVAPGDDEGCSDGNPCTNGDACANGACAGKLTGCDDGNPCTTDPATCDPAVACASVKVADGALCTDNDACTKGDACAAGACAGGKVDCDDGQKCTSDGCVAETGCFHKKLECDDSNPCTVDSCDAAVGCVNKAIPQGGACDDGVACTTGETCNGGACGKPASLNDALCNDNKACTLDKCGASGCNNDWGPKGTSCLDGPCYQGVCDMGSCAHGGPGTGPVDCDDKNPCTIDSCDAVKGCMHAAGGEGNACDNGNACDGAADACTAGVCKGTKPKDCDDKNSCTDDKCYDGTCSNSFVKWPGAECDDGNPCTMMDKCTSQGACAGFTPPGCEDGNPCTTDSAACDPVKGCTHTPKADGAACDDNSACTSGEVCTAGACKGAQKNCDDGDACTDDQCNPQSAACSHGTKCMDENPCTVDACDKVTGACTFAALPIGTTCTDGNACTSGDTCVAGACKGTDSCEDGDACTLDQCDPGSGACLHKSPCDDNQACTLDKCDKVSGACDHTLLAGNAPCDDGNACTSGEKCLGGQCVAGTPGQPGAPCLFTAPDGCGGASVCTPDGTCQPQMGPPCDDKNACTTDVCLPGFGCGHAPVADASPCNDGSACTSGDACIKGTCGGTVKDCDDKQPCTTDSCEPGGGCAHKATADGGTCNDGLACTTGDKCGGGACAGTASDTACDDSNVCTVDACTVTGCTHTAKACDDGNKCTVDSCDAVKGCVTTAKNCEDGNSCTTNSCNPATGNCTMKWLSDMSPCDDGNKCQGDADVCTAGTCKMSGKITMCMDGNPCTADACDPATAKCSYPNATDGTVCAGQADVCNNYFTCQKGACENFQPINCDDGNSCTTDSCDNVGGVGKCKSVPGEQGSACTKPSGICTFPGLCDGSGTCGAEKPNTCDDANKCTTDSCNPSAPEWAPPCTNTPIPGCTP